MEIAVLGAGLAGLGFATELPSARIYEAKTHPGGHASSRELGGVHFDEGAHISHTRDAEFRRMIEENAGKVHDGVARAVRNYWRGTWTGYPVQNHLRDLPTEIRIKALTDIVLAAANRSDSEPTTYREWCQRQYGDYLTEEFYEVFTKKYWRCSTDELATDWLGGRLIPTDLTNIIRGSFAGEVQDQAAFAQFRYPTSGGFFGFFSGLYDDLNVHLDRRAVEIDVKKGEVRFASGDVAGFDVLASSIPLPDLVSAVTSAPEPIRRGASGLRHTKLLCVNLVIEQPNLTDSPWCYIYDLDIDAARLSFPTNLSPTGTPERTTAIQAEVFASPEEVLGNPDVLIERTITQLAPILEFRPDEVIAAGTVESSHAYVVSDHDRATAVDAILGWLAEQGIYSMGLYGRWKYVWSDAAYRSGQEVARQVKADHGIH